MKRKLFVFLSLVLMASMVLSACSSAKTPPAQPTVASAKEATQAPKSDRKGGWLDKIIFSAIPEVQPAVAQLQAGAVDMYAVSADDANSYAKIKEDKSLDYAEVYGSNNQMLLNTSTCSDANLLNPFTSMKIREAMNWAIDRNYVSQEIMGGLGKPKYTVLTSAFLDYSRYADILSAIETKYAYNLDKAKQIVNTEMKGLSAELGSDGKWQYKGKPVKVIGVIRTEDKRKEIGNYFANQLEAMGFTVDRLEKERKEAGPIWQGEPKDCKFHFYTAGWVNVAVSRDDGNNFLQYNTGEIQPIPVMKDYKPSKELYDVSQQLMNNKFNSLDERREMFKKALDLSMTESWWGVWVNDNISYSPYRQGIEDAYDLAGGFASAQLWPYTIRLAGKEGGEVKIAQSGILVNPWNPISGSNFTDDSMIERGAMDWGQMYDPYTGLSLPKLINKMDVVAQQGLPVHKTMDWVNLSFEKEITVPGDAWVDWDATKQQFITAAEKFPEGVKAKTKATLYYIPELTKTTWHDGSAFSVADIVMDMIMSFDPAKKESKIYDESTVATLDTTLSMLKGFKLVSTDPVVIEVYQDGYTLDAENTVNSNYNFTFYPSYTYGPGAWHNLVPAILAEENNELAFSTDKAQAKKIEWTSLVAGPSLEIEAKYLDKAASEKFIPYAPTLSKYITPEEAAARYDNLKKWYAEKKHFFIGTGPYFVDQVFPVEGTITLARNPNYLFPADQWSNYAEPKLVTASVGGPTTVVAGEEASFDVSVMFGDQPYPAADLEKVSYVLYNANNEVVGSGDATLVEDGQYQVVLNKDLTSKLEAGGSKLTVSVSSKLVSIPAFTSYEFVVTK